MAVLNLLNTYPQVILVSFDNDLVQATNQEGVTAVYAHDLDSLELETRLKAARQFIGS
jgi:hypothetical protein